ncbi:hypothetical protein TWF694_003848 [Orbilia ellipsospora]|uniref:Peptidase S54 rhomboid domain-containing protein n=1 Tax=Orbilia ellipsospora TaxID=2528407 RepID=A0AAV9X5F2_9PEZI
MIPIWRPCATKGALSLSTMSSARIACQSVSSRVSLLIPQSQAGTSFSRSISSSLSRIQSYSKPTRIPRTRIISPSEHNRAEKLTTTYARYYSSLRRSSTRRPDQPSVSKPTFTTPSSRFPTENKTTDQLPENLTITHKAENELAPSGADQLKVGSSEWYEYYSQKAREDAKVDDKLDPDDIPAFRRLLPSAVFLVVILGGCLYYATTYIPPATTTRMFPSVPMAMATVWGIVAANGLVFLSWRVRPLWRFLNTYFVQRPGDPRFFALIGNTFSHHTFWHFGANMLGLFFLGTTRKLFPRSEYETKPSLTQYYSVRTNRPWQFLGIISRLWRRIFVRVFGFQCLCEEVLHIRTGCVRSGLWRGWRICHIEP